MTGAPQPKLRQIIYLIVAVVGILAVRSPAAAQTSGCTLIPDDQNPSEKILRCGNYLTLKTATGTRYQLENQPHCAPDTAHLETGALMIEFHGGKGHQNFQILTPQAIASVRGTKWIVEIGERQVSTFVMSGLVVVTRRNGVQSATLEPGQGADVDAGAGPIEVKRWAAARVKALLARFGQ